MAEPPGSLAAIALEIDDVLPVLVAHRLRAEEGAERHDLPAALAGCLHRMGRHPRLDYIRAGRRPDEKQGFDQLVRRVEFSLGSLSEDERRRLETWYREDPERAERGREPYRWAFVSWETERDGR